jgi:hypothetical protein
VTIDLTAATMLSRRELLSRTYAAVSPRAPSGVRGRRPVGGQPGYGWSARSQAGGWRPGGRRPGRWRPDWRRLGAWRTAGRRPGERLTGRGGVVAVFAACFLGLLLADWANWGELADAVFFMASSLTAYYVRPSGLLPVVVSPPLLFFSACVLEKALTSSGLLTAFSGTVVALANSAGWLFAGTGLTIFIALLRGLRSEVRYLVVALRSLVTYVPRAARAEAGTTYAP